MTNFKAQGDDFIENIVWGYARVSSIGQNLGRQIEQLTAYGIEPRYIRSEKQSGKDFDRPEFLSLVGTDVSAPCMRKGDCLVVTSLDRLGRNYNEIREWWRRITSELECDIVVLDMPLLDTRNKGGTLENKFVSELVLQILSYVSEKERNSIRERQRQGIATAHKNGVRFGRPKTVLPTNYAQVMERWLNKEITATVAIKELKIGKNVFYREAKKYIERRNINEHK